MRIAPPLLIGEVEIDLAVEMLDTAFAPYSRLLSPS
jgi:hypothetical protein